MQCCLNRPIYLKALSSELRILFMFCFQCHLYYVRLNLTSSTNIDLLTALCSFSGPILFVCLFFEIKNIYSDTH